MLWKLSTKTKGGLQWKFPDLTLFALVPGLKWLVLWNANIYAALLQRRKSFWWIRWMHSFILHKTEKNTSDLNFLMIFFFQLPTLIELTLIHDCWIQSNHSLFLYVFLHVANVTKVLSVYSCVFIIYMYYSLQRFWDYKINLKCQSFVSMLYDIKASIIKIFVNWFYIR